MRDSLPLFVSASLFAAAARHNRRDAVGAADLAHACCNAVARRNWRRNRMKAAYLEQTGGPEVLKYGDLPDPKAGPGDVVVDIVAASVNGADWKVRRGEYGRAEISLRAGPRFLRHRQRAGRGRHRFQGRRCGVRRAAAGAGGHLRREDRDQGRGRREKARQPVACERRGAGADRPDRAATRSRTRSSSSAARPSWSRAAPAASRATRSSLPSTSARRSSPPPARPTSTMCARSAPTR